MTRLSVPVTLPLSELEARCERFTRECVWAPTPVRVTVEVLATDLGAQRPIFSSPLRGVSYEPRTGILELSLEDGTHRIQGVREVWLAAETKGFIELLEVVREDGGKEILTFAQSRRR